MPAPHAIYSKMLAERTASRNVLVLFYFIYFNATGFLLKGIGSEGKVASSDIHVCNGVVHTVDTVLLPFDGDGELDGEAGVFKEGE